MRTGSKQKLKYVIILEILRQETDADHHAGKEVVFTCGGILMLIRALGRNGSGKR